MPRRALRPAPSFSLSPYFLPSYELMLNELLVLLAEFKKALEGMSRINTLYWRFRAQSSEEGWDSIVYEKLRTGLGLYIDALRAPCLDRRFP